MSISAKEITSLVYKAFEARPGENRGRITHEEADAIVRKILKDGVQPDELAAVRELRDRMRAEYQSSFKVPMGETHLSLFYSLNSLDEMVESLEKEAKKGSGGSI